MIEVRPAASCTYDVVALGEVMLRLDPGEGRIRTARRFDVWEGGGEYNVARGLSSVFGHRAAVVTALVDNEVGRLVEGLVRSSGLDASLVRWSPFDGVGRAARNGLNFTERGFGVRGALGVSDRAGTAISRLGPGQVDWDDLLGRRGVRWLHTGGILAGLSESCTALALEAMTAARRHGTAVSYDTNYRPSLWAGSGGHARAREVNRELAQHADVVLGGPADFPDPPEGGDLLADLATLGASLPTASVVASTRRVVHSAGDNDWQVVGWSAATGALTSVARDHLAILDRVGGGDGFASGLVHGLLEGAGLQRALELGAAHGALAMTTPGDTSMATQAEVEALAGGGSARSQR
ncbi:sugar kinase [uncultured Nocardioides sp.]|uniref:sugar kinase n=1 Tax=uncultured Nocardioides sp. TaxID=198441 RepID=UPI002605D52B|nr:sugar kinase [uncultured Nocardioides sp.]